MSDEHMPKSTLFQGTRDFGYGDLTPTERLELSRKRAATLNIIQPKSGAPLDERLETLARNIQKGVYEVPAELLLTRKSKEFLLDPVPSDPDAKRDLRLLRKQFYKNVPLVLEGLNGPEPAQYGFHRFTAGRNTYAFRTIDLMRAIVIEGTSDKLHKQGIVKSQDGRARPRWYYKLDRTEKEYSVIVDILGKARHGEHISAIVHGLPSLDNRAELPQDFPPEAQGLIRAPRVTVTMPALEVLRYKVPEDTTPLPEDSSDAPVGRFSIVPSSAQWPLFQRGRDRRWNVSVARENHKLGWSEFDNTRFLNARDITAVLRVDSILRRNQLELNHPFRRFSNPWLDIPAGLYSQGVIVTDGKPRYPSVGEIEVMTRLVLAANEPQVIGSRERMSFYRVPGLQPFQRDA